MQSYRSFGYRSQLLGSVLILVILSLLNMPGNTYADVPGFMTIDIHDGEPWIPSADTDRYSASGNFMTGIDTWGYGFKVERIWFYHGGDYPDSGAPYQVHFIRRRRSGEEEEFDNLTYFDRTTTCNHCWEELAIGYNVWEDGSDDGRTFGIFIRPFGGTVAHPYPMLWIDRYTNHDQLAAVIEVNFPPPPGPILNFGSRDTYDLDYYFSDHGLGEVLLGMEISSDVIISTRQLNFSTIKSLY